MREALQSALRTFDSMVVLRDSMHWLAAGIAVAVAVAFVGHLVASSAAAAAAAVDDSGIVDCIVTKLPRSPLCQRVE